MASTREPALTVLGLAGTPDADAATIQRAFERMARRYPQPHFPERFRHLLEARDCLLHAGRSWREQLESRTLDLTWLPRYLAHAKLESIPDRRTALQAMLRAGYLAETLDPDGLEGLMGRLRDDDLPF